MRLLRLLLFVAAITTLYSIPFTALGAHQDGSRQQSVTDGNLHQDVLKLVQEQGMRATLEKQVQSNLDNAKDEMMKACRRCTSEFGDEWVKRMHKQLKIDDFVAVVVRVYEKYLDDNQVREMIALTIARKESKPAEPSPALKEKLASIMVAMQSEIIGGCAQVGARTGGEVGQQIEKEHPEYMRPVDASEKN